MQTGWLSSCHCIDALLGMLCAGVRSLTLLEHLLTSGSGQGRVAFLDLRTMTYVPVRGERLETLHPSCCSCSSAGSQSESRPANAARFPHDAIQVALEVASSLE